MVMSNITDAMCMYHDLMDEVTKTPLWVQMMFTVLMLIIFVVGVAGNLVTCIVIYCDRSMHTATNYYLFNLAVSDLIVSFGILLDINSLSEYPFDFYGYGNAFCRMHFFLVVALWNNGILIMTALAIERYIAVWHPLLVTTRQVWPRVTKIMYMIWTVAILEALPEIWTVYLIRNKRSSFCFIVPTPFAKILNGVLALMTFVIPLTIMTFVYTMVAVKVRVTQKSNSKDNIFNHRNNSSRVNKLITLTVSFLVCWLPFFTLRVLVVVLDWCHKPWLLKNWDMMLMLVSLNGWFSIVLNPMLFSLMSTKFRKALKALWKTKFKRQASIPRPQTVLL